MNKSYLTFNQRFIDDNKPLIYDDFPKESKIALAHVLVSMYSKGYLLGITEMKRELERVGRMASSTTSDEEPFNAYFSRLYKMSYIQIFNFCERVYSLFLSNGYGQETPLEEVKNYYSNEINTIMGEDNFGYIFTNGEFYRIGRPITQKTQQRVKRVLSDPLLSDSLDFFTKATNFFNQLPDPDSENCVKDSICALEAAVQKLTNKNSSKDFDKIIKQIQGNGEGEIPIVIADGIIKLHVYRGSGTGVAHAAIEGAKVTKYEAELVLNLTAIYITYLYDVLKPQVEIPF